MTSHTNPALSHGRDSEEVFSVTAFALQVKITSDVQLRLLSFLGFAMRWELLMDVRLKTRVR